MSSRQKKKKKKKRKKDMIFAIVSSWFCFM